MQPDDRPSITPLLAPSTTHSPAADQAWHVVNPVRVLSIRDVAKLALRNRRPNSDGDGMADSPTAALPSVADTFVAREAVDHPWRGRRETWCVSLPMLLLLPRTQHCARGKACALNVQYARRRRVLSVAIKTARMQACLSTS